MISLVFMIWKETRGRDPRWRGEEVAMEPIVPAIAAFDPPPLLFGERAARNPDTHAAAARGIAGVNPTRCAVTAPRSTMGGVERKASIRDKGRKSRSGTRAGKDVGGISCPGRGNKR
jgi:hypothetical protein